MELRRSTWSSGCRGESEQLWPVPGGPDRYSDQTRGCPQRCREEKRGPIMTDDKQVESGHVLLGLGDWTNISTIGVGCSVGVTFHSIFDILFC